MREVMISIQPKWCELIANGKKTVEVRKTRPKCDVPFKCYIYMTKAYDTIFGRGNPKRVCVGGGVVIGEFVCDRIQSYECEFVDDDCYEEIASVFVDEDGDETGFIEWSNDGDLPYECIDLYQESCIQYNELKKYMGMGFGTFYGWHISDLVIYDEPKELSEFWNAEKCHYASKYGCTYKYHCFRAGQTKRCGNTLTRPPQSWCYVKGAENNG